MITDTQRRYQILRRISKMSPDKLKDLDEYVSKLEQGTGNFIQFQLSEFRPMIIIKRIAVFFIASIFVFAIACSAIGFEVVDVEFTSHGAQLSGAIVFPDKSVVAAIVFVHGSGKQTRNLGLAKRFVAEGIAALVYDKRGVGASEGEYVQKRNIREQNLNLLADDAVAALEALHEHPKMKDVPVGFAGISQAGWIIPLAAEKSAATQFIALWSGPVCKISEEDIYSSYTSDRDFDNLPGFEEVRKLRKKPYKWPQEFGKDTDSGASWAAG